MKNFMVYKWMLAGLVLTLSGAATASSLQAQEKSLIDIVSSLEKDGIGPIVEVEFDDGVWEIEGYRDDIAYEFKVDPKTGKMVSEHRDDTNVKPPADSLRLSEILKKLDQAEYIHIREISFENRSWEVEASRNGQRRELRVDPKDGTVLSDRIDD